MRRPAKPKDIAQLLVGRRTLDQPRPGYFRLKLVRHGPWVPATIRSCQHEPGEPENILDRPPYLVATIGDKDADPYTVWERGDRITEAEYRWRLALREWARGTRQPEATPTRPADIATLPSIF